MLIFELIFIPILLFLLISIVLLPFHFALHSIINIVSIPTQLIKIATNNNLRVNHALEHSTINILEKKYGYQKLAGYATEKGFVIQGIIDPNHLKEAAVIGKARLEQGEQDLVIHNRCGTSILAANFTSAVIFIILLWQTGMFSLINIMFAILLSQFVGPITGKIIQKYLTTSSKVSNYNIVNINYQSTSKALGFFMQLKPTQFFVKTRPKSFHEVTLNMKETKQWI